MSDIGPGDLYRMQQERDAPRGPGDWYRAQTAMAAPRVDAPHGIGNALLYGIQSSATGLALRGEKPGAMLPTDATWGERMTAGVANVVTDLPLSIAAAVAGAAGGGSAGGAVAGPPGMVVGGAVGGGAMAVGVPMAVRDALMQAYDQGGVHTFSDALNIAWAGAKGFGQGAVIGGATAGAGKYAGGVFAKSGVMTRGAAVLSAETATLTTASAALEGHMPHAQDFVDSAVMIFGLKASMAGAAKLRTIYAKTGKTPEQVVAEASKDPVLQAELVGGERKVVNPILKDGVIDEAATLATLPEVADGFVRLFRATSPTVKFDDVFDAAKLKDFAPDKLAGRHYTPDLSYADYFRKTYGKDAVVEYVDLPAAGLKRFEVAPGEYVVPDNAIPSRYQPIAAEENAKAAMAGAAKLRMIYAKTGVPPEQVAAEAARDPSFKAELEAEKVYHGTKATEAKVPDVTGLSESRDLGPHFSTSEKTARIFAEDGGTPGRVLEGQIHPTKILDMPDMAGWHPLQVAEWIDQQGMTGRRPAGENLGELGSRTLQVVQEATRRGADIEKATAAGASVVRSWLRGQGYDAIRYTNTFEGQPVPTYIALDPSIIKPVEAASPIPIRLRPAAAEENAKAAVPEMTPQDRARMAELQAKPFEQVPQAPGEPTQPTHVNYNYINGPEELMGALSRLSKFNEAEIQVKRRGVVPLAETAREAQTIVEDVLNGKVAPEHVAPNLQNLDARMVAMKQMVVGSAEAWRQAGADLAAKGANASAAEVASFLQMTHRVSMIHSEFLGQRAEVGRALNALKTISDASKNIKDLDLLLRKEGGTANIMEIAKLAAETENPAQAAAAAKAAVAPNALDKVIEVFKAFTLSGLTTHMANILGNVSSMFLQPIDRAVAAGVGKALGTPDRVRLAEVPAEVNGMVHGTLDGLRLAGEIIRGRQPIGDKVDLTSGAIGGRTGEVVRVPFKLLTAEDALFRTMAERGEAYALATRQAFKERLTPGTREYDNRIVELVANPPEAMAEAIAEQGHRAVFTTKLGTRGTHLQLLVRGSLFEFVLPYLRTPINLFKWAVEHTPAGFMMKEVRDAFAAGGVQRDMAVARMIVGGVIGTIVFAGVKDGVVTGSGLTEPEKMRAKRAAGWQPYSFKIGDKYYSYQRLDPVARLIATAADVGELWETADTGQRPEIAATVMASIGNATISQTYLSGLANAVNAITDPTRYGKRWIDQYAASMVPGLIGQMAVAKDPYVREINTVLDAVQSRIPIWRESLLPKRNPLTGEAVKAPESLFPFAPIRVSQESHDKVLTEAARLGIPLGNAPKAISVGKNTGKIGKIELSDEQRNAFTEEQGKLAYHYLKPLVDSPWWDALRDVEKTMVYHKVLKKVRVQAGATVLPPEARAAEIPRILDEMLGPDASTSGVGQ